MAQDDRSSPYRVVGSIALVVGLLLTGTGITWSYLVPSSAFWTESDANAYTEATAAVHAAISRPADSPGDTSPNSAQEQLESAKAKLAEVENRLETARNRQRYGGPITSLIGLVLAITGVGLLRHGQQDG
ncbi:hypothetical protein [Aeoliella sp. SH292]|uniref:hypothetical protein n=1 Tax=Aeoliella sp. SH292 TaxID=3454464 RepID=UPI003F9CE09C